MFFDSILENVLICDTLNMSNHNIVYMSIAINNFTNIEIYMYLIVLGKKQQQNISVSMNCN